MVTKDKSILSYLREKFDKDVSILFKILTFKFILERNSKFKTTASFTSDTQ